MTLILLLVIAKNEMVKKQKEKTMNIMEAHIRQVVYVNTAKVNISHLKGGIINVQNVTQRRESNE